MPDIKLKGWSGNEVTHKDVPFVWLADPSQEIGELEEGETSNLLPFTYGIAQSKVVVPDFSGGDMSVPIAPGELVTDLTIVKPADLIPENIPEGMYLAGVGPGTFAGGGGLIDYTNTNVTTSTTRQYSGLAGIRSFTFTELQKVGMYCFYQCTDAVKFDFHVATEIGTSAFMYCPVEVLIIRTSTMCTTPSNTAGILFGYGIGAFKGNLYVPSSLVETYKADEAWGYWADKIRAIEDYPDICG